VNFLGVGRIAVCLEFELVLLYKKELDLFNPKLPWSSTLA